LLFFQAEDGIRARNVTGVQTCALPIFPEVVATRVQVCCCLHHYRDPVGITERAGLAALRLAAGRNVPVGAAAGGARRRRLYGARSEERRVGEEGGGWVGRGGGDKAGGG